MTEAQTLDDLQTENAELKRRLEEVEETLDAIRRGAVDAFLVEENRGERVYTLQTADRPYRLFFEKMHQGAATLLADGTVACCNDTLADMLGVPMESLIGISLGQFITEDDAPIYQRLLAQSEFRPGQGEARLRRADGELISAYLTFNALPSDCGATIGVLVTDLTSQRHHEKLAAAHEALRNRETRLRLAMEVSATGMWEWDMVTNKVLWSPECYLIHDLSEEEFDGTAETFIRSLHPEDRDRVWNTVQESAERNTKYECEFRIVRPSGEIRWVANLGRVIYDDKARPRKMIGTLTDITLRKQSEGAVARSDERFRRAADASGTLVYDVDLQSATADAEVYGIEHILGEGTSGIRYSSDWWHERIHPVDRPIHLESLNRSLKDPRCDSYRAEYSVRHADGQWRNVLDVARIVRDPVDLRPVSIVGTIVDVTDRKRAEEALKEADRRKDEFLAMLAHELRNPLAPVLNSLELMKRAANNRGLMEKAQSTIERQISQMVRLIDDLLDVSRITRNKLELKKSHVELSVVVQHAVETCRPHCERAGHQLHIHLPTEPIHLFVDSIRLAQVLGNLLTNSCKYMDPGGHIWLSIDRENDQVVAKVRDIGVGIPSDMLPKIFDLFTQVDRSLERSEGGLGIGLSLVKRLVEMHGGTVTVSSEGPGRGSEFTVRLPILAESTAAPVPSHPTRDSASSRRILVVDDNIDSAESLALLLKLSGNETLTAHDGMEAVESAAKFQPEVILLDIGLPRLNGYEACRRIREQLGGEQIFMIALTGWGQDGDRRKAKEAGFDGHLVKPVDHAALLEQLAHPQRTT